MTEQSWRSKDQEDERQDQMIPDCFDGSVPIMGYMCHFEACARINGWTEEDALYYLTASLRGDAVVTQQTVRQLTYGELAYRLKQRFGCEEESEVFVTGQQARCQRPGKVQYCHEANFARS